MRFAILLTALLGVLPAQAQPQPTTQSMTCDRARSFVQAQGATVLYTGPGTFERFVASPRSCVRGETTETAYAATRDSARCPVGLRCRPSHLDELEPPR
ncbi:MAG TPA: hypothetical protein VGU45_16280 [Microvirga sp.]|jgi:hypothetical protein|nr:hypothetical protein [Microvirga sp.]